MKETIDRRKFLHGATLASACLLCGTAVEFFSGCESEKKISADRKTDFTISSIEALQTIGGAIKTKLDGVNGGKTIMIIRATENEFTVLAAQCTHKSVEVKLPKEGIIKCPAHGSQYKTDGTVIEGEAIVPLKKIASTFNSEKNILTIG